MTFKCPVCGGKLFKIDKGRYECRNMKCPVIETRISYDAISGFKIKITKMDTILFSKELEKRLLNDKANLDCSRTSLNMACNREQEE